jgi:uncharacterized membrane protein
MENQEKPSEETIENWRKDPANWILGIFYFNKKDKRIFPSKRLSFLGWTVNFANPLSVLTLVVIILSIILFERFA